MYLALVLGPTIGAPKVRVTLVIEGLEMKIWGDREDISEEDLLSSEGGDDEDYSIDDGSTVLIFFISYYCTKSAVPYNSRSLSRGRMCLWKQHTQLFSRQQTAHP